MERFELGEGRALSAVDAGRKLALRARLPGAHLFDRATHALRVARAQGLSLEHRLELAFASSWLVNSPAPSPALRALSDPPNVWLLIALAHTLQDLRVEISEAMAAELTVTVDSLSLVLGDKREQGAEVLSKILALVLPETVPLLPEPACRYLLGEPPTAPGPRFVQSLQVFRRATQTLNDPLVAVARDHKAAVLEPAQVLDRVLWFDSEGHRHFPPLANPATG